MYEAFIKTNFSAAHHLREYAGKCANQHGHNWEVKVSLACDTLDSVGMAVDFVEMKREVSAALTELDHHDLNDLPYFQAHNPTAENIARYLFDTLRARLDTERVRVSRVTVYETPSAGASFSLDS